MEKLFVLAGKARSGKDSAADIIEGYYNDKKIIKLMYGCPIKHYAKILSNWDGSEETKPRTLLQEIGVESRKINPGYTTRRMEEDINILKKYFDIIIITDTRMKDEIIMPKQKFKETVTIKLVRDNFESELSKNEQKNITETALDNYNDYDYIVHNSGTLEDLKQKIIKIIESEES